MSTFDDFKPGYLALPEELNQKRTPEMVIEAAQVVGMVRHFVESGGDPAAQPQPIVRFNTTELAQEARRDELVRRLALDWEVTVDERLRGAERRWKAALDATGAPYNVPIEPWMKPYLKIEDDNPNTTRPGVVRWALLTEKDDKEYFLHEIEIEDGETITGLMTFGAHPVIHQEPVSAEDSPATETTPATEATPAAEATAAPAEERARPAKPQKHRVAADQPQAPVEPGPQLPGFSFFQ